MTTSWRRSPFMTCVAAVISAAVSAAGADERRLHGYAQIDIPSDLGSYELAFKLGSSGNFEASDSYIDVERTLLFPTVAEVDGKPIGPGVYGTYTDQQFTLSSIDFQSAVAGRSVTRRIGLSDARFSEGGRVIEGTYRETVEGLRAERFTIEGTFLLTVPQATAWATLVDLQEDGCVDFLDIRRAGLDPNRVELGDLSAALEIERGGVGALVIGNPGDGECTDRQQVLEAATSAYRSTR